MLLFFYLQGGGVYDLEGNDDDLADPDEWEDASTSDEDAPLDEENPLLLLPGPGKEEEGGETAESDVEAGEPSTRAEVDPMEGCFMQGDEVVLHGQASDYAFDKDLVLKPGEDPVERISKETEDLMVEWVKG